MDFEANNMHVSQRLGVARRWANSWPMLPRPQNWQSVQMPSIVALGRLGWAQITDVMHNISKALLRAKYLPKNEKKIAKQFWLGIISPVLSKCNGVVPHQRLCASPYNTPTLPDYARVPRIWYQSPSLPYRSPNLPFELSVLKFFTAKTISSKWTLMVCTSFKTLYNVHSHTHVIFWGLRQFVNIGGGGW